MAPPEKDHPLLLARFFPGDFCRKYLDWRPYPYQEAVLDAVLLQRARRVAWLAGRRVGKSTTISTLSLILALTRPGLRTLLLGPAERHGLALLDSVRERLQGSMFEDRVTLDRSNELRLGHGVDHRGRSRESVLKALSMAAQIRGEGADVVIVDESAQCKSEDYRQKVLPFVLGRPGSIIMHCSTVWADDDHFMDAVNTWPRVFVTPTRMRPGTEEDIAEARATMTDAEFRREIECEVGALGGVFDRRALMSCTVDEPLHDMATLTDLRPRQHHTYYVGVDWAKQQDQAVIAAVAQGSQDKVNRARLAFLQVYPPDPGNPNHYTRIVDHVVQVAKHLDAARVVVDRGEGAFQAEVLQKALGSRLVAYPFTVEARDRLVENALYLVEKQHLEIPREPDIVRRAFANVRRGEAGGYEHASRTTKDVFDAVALALLQVQRPTVGHERAPAKLLAVRPGGGGVGLWGPEPPRLPDMRQVMFGREAMQWAQFAEETT